MVLIWVSAMEVSCTSRCVSIIAKNVIEWGGAAGWILIPQLQINPRDWIVHYSSDREGIEFGNPVSSCGEVGIKLWLRIEGVDESSVLFIVISTTYRLLPAIEKILKLSGIRIVTEHSPSYGIFLPSGLSFYIVISLEHGVGECMHRGHCLQRLFRLECGQVQPQRYHQKVWGFLPDIVDMVSTVIDALGGSINCLPVVVEIYDGWCANGICCFHIWQILSCKQNEGSWVCHWQLSVISIIGAWLNGCEMVRACLQLVKWIHLANWHFRFQDNLRNVSIGVHVIKCFQKQGLRSIQRLESVHWKLKYLTKEVPCCELFVP